ncbi:class I mannose-6-phosphate isomerase [Paenibacillus sp. HB172176]|uniref:class I mannose-6-phosphate isomerase n=1 Tax=Paenibacillus sp. HB172176 TaxID=2493690 RepID=UPI00143C1B84|nr:class I mannose-6-phosphate isomerase [Paenibacillus sp. HB172176]
MFNKMPVNLIRRSETKLSEGYSEIMRDLEERLAACERGGRIVIDGTNGADFNRFAAELENALAALGDRTTRIAVQRFLRTDDKLRQRFAGDITDNRAFGRMTEGGLEDFFRADARAACEEEILQARVSNCSEREWVIVAGVGAYFLTGGGQLNVFLDLSRETQQTLHKGELNNFGFQSAEDALEKYKIAFFVEWPVLEQYRKRHLREFDVYADMNDGTWPIAVGADALVEMIAELAEGPMRVKPFFAPGVWGGQYLKKLADLPGDWENCAWSFEPIAPENSILLGVGGNVIDVPFMLVMNLSFEAILGGRVSALFGDFFPIRFDYLDTIGGTNLSVQVHPKQAYVEENFNYILEQQESYYIMEKKEGSKVYLGLTDECEKTEFLGAVEEAQDTGNGIDHTLYVKEWECEKGDLFLIPTGTVHCSGNDNLVLEISSTPWWFTFKIYDYVRPGMDGKPRPINIDHAKANIDWHKKPDWVKRELIGVPTLAGRQGASEEYRLGYRDDLLFYVNRIHLAEAEVWEEDTQGEMLMFNLVEGERVRIEPLSNWSAAVELGYAESYILPAALGKFRIVNIGGTPAKLIKAGVSPQWDIRVVHE